MRSRLLAFSLAALGVAAQAGMPSPAELEAHGVPLSDEQLQQLIPGAKVIGHAANGDTVVWTNNLNGTLVASSDARGGSNLGGQRLASGEGSWRIRNGAYCVEVQMPKSERHFCRRMYKVGDKYYGFPLRAEGRGRVMEFEFRK